MNHDTHYNPGGGGAAYAVRNPDQVPEPGDRVRTLTGAPGRPVYGTVTDVVTYEEEDEPTYELTLDNGVKTGRYLSGLTFHGRPHAAFNKGGA